MLMTLGMWFVIHRGVHAISQWLVRRESRQGGDDHSLPVPAEDRGLVESSRNRADPPSPLDPKNESFGRACRALKLQ